VCAVSDGEISFGPYRLDRANARLVREGRAVALTPKAFDVLCHLVGRPDQLVTKEELLAAVWPDVVVSDASIKVCVGEIRKALEDDPQKPTYIETVHRRGYRFISPVFGAVGEGAANSCPPPAPGTGAPARAATAAAGRHPLVGRAPELQVLDAHLDRAARGERQTVFIVGAAGSGKTALVEAFVRQVRARAGAGDAPVCAVGHCFEQFGTNEPYLPVWEAAGQLGWDLPDRPPDGAAASLPGRTRSGGGSGAAVMEPQIASERMLRDILDAIERAAADRPVVLVLEDLHWADYSTLDVISALARRRTPARLLVLGTYRPGELHFREHPLRTVAQELLARRLCAELPLAPLDEGAVAHYLAARFRGRALPDALAGRLFARTGGHPLFLASLIDHLIERDAPPPAGAVGGAAGDDAAVGGGDGPAGRDGGAVQRPRGDRGPVRAADPRRARRP